MSAASGHPDPDLLLSHAGWVRGLALRLLRDPDQAEDVAQKTLLAAWEKPPQDTTFLPAWLKRVARNFALSERRRSERAQRRELAASPPAAPRGPAELAEEAEALRCVVEELLRLEEPFRGVLLLRYFEQLSPSEIAERLGLPPATVRSRQTRGLARLRARLESRFGPGGLANGLAPLLPGLAPPVTSALVSTSLLSTVLAMSTPAKLALVAAGLTLITFVGWMKSTRPVAESSRESLAPAPASAVEDGGDRIAAAVGIVTREARTVLPPADGVLRGLVFVRLVDPLGNPIPGGKVRTSSTSTNWLKNTCTGEDWDSQWHQSTVLGQATSGQDGVVELHGIPTEQPLVLIAEAPGKARAGVIHPSEEGAAEQDMGEIVLLDAGALEVQVVDADGSPVVGAAVRIESEPVIPIGTFSVFTLPTDDRGRVVFRHLVTQPQSLRVTARGFLPAEENRLVPGDPDAALKIIVLDRGGGVNGLVSLANGQVAAGVPVYVIPESDSSAFRRPTRYGTKDAYRLTESDAHGAFIVTGLESGVNYLVYARKSATLGAVSAPVAAGERVELALPPIGLMSGRVVLDGQPMPQAQVGLVEVTQPFEESELFFRTDDEGRFARELAPGRYGVFLFHPLGQAMLGPFNVVEETQLGDLAMVAGVPLEISVVSASDGSPVSPWVLPNREQAYELTATPEAWQTRLRDDRPRSFGDVAWPEEGIVRLNYLPPGKHRLRVTAIGFLSERLEVELEASHPLHVDVAMEPETQASIRLLGAQGKPVTTGSFMLCKTELDGRTGLWSYSSDARPDLDGWLNFNGARPGRFHLVEAGDQWKRKLAEVEIRRGDNRLELQLPTRPELRVTVLDADGPVADAEVSAMQITADIGIMPVYATTGADGIASLPRLWQADHRIAVESPGRPKLNRRVSLTEPVERVEFRYAGVTVSGRLVIPGSQPIQGGLVWFYQREKPDGGTSFDGRVPCTADGRFEFRNMPPGEYRINATASGFLATLSTEVLVDDEAIDGILIELHPDCGLRVQVSGIPEFLTVHAADYFQARLAPQTGGHAEVQGFLNDGAILFEKLRPGAYTLRFFRQNIQDQRMVDTLIEEVPVSLGPPGTVQDLPWTPRSD